MTDPTLIEFRRHMGEAAKGLSESELAQWMASLQWIADQAIAFALRSPCEGRFGRLLTTGSRHPIVRDMARA